MCAQFLKTTKSLPATWDCPAVHIPTRSLLHSSFRLLVLMKPSEIDMESDFPHTPIGVLVFSFQLAITPPLYPQVLKSEGTFDIYRKDVIIWYQFGCGIPKMLGTKKQDIPQFLKSERTFDIYWARSFSPKSEFTGSSIKTKWQPVKKYKRVCEKCTIKPMKSPYGVGRYHRGPNGSFSRK